MADAFGAGSEDAGADDEGKTAEEKIMMSIAQVIDQIKLGLPQPVELVAVSKFHPFQLIEQAYGAGQRIFAESRPQELLAKIKQLDSIREERHDPNYMSDIQWHFIGHLQTNKLKMVLPYVSLVQSVDSVRLLDAIDSWAGSNDTVVSVLLEPHVASEESKQGFDEDEIYAILERACNNQESDTDPFYRNIRFRGIMGMATYTDNESVVRTDFERLKSIFDRSRALYPALNNDFTELSIGMSDDYKIAVEYGSTMVRIGSMIFGQRL